MVKTIADRNRNSMCRLREVDYRGVRHIIMENELLRVTVAPGKGSDITELLYKPLDLECLWHSGVPIQNPGSLAASRIPSGGAFLPLYEGGWQELFPNYGAPCTYKGAEYGLHGQVCVVPWEYEIQRDEEEEICVHLWVRASAPYLLERWMTLKTDDPTLYIKGKATNESPVEMECMWGHHPVLGPPFLDESCEIIPAGSGLQATTLDGAGALPDNRKGDWPVMRDRDGGETNLSRVNPAEKRQYREYGLGNLSEGLCTVWNHNRNIGFRLRWERERFPYLWIWEPDCGNQNYPWYGRNYALGVEPWSHLAGSLEEVVKRGDAIRLAPWASMETELSAGICLERGGG